MSQLNMHLNPEFIRDLEAFMKLRGLKTKSEAIRLAIREGLERTRAGAANFKKFSQLRGFALRAPLNSNPRFKNEDDIWEVK